MVFIINKLSSKHGETRSLYYLVQNYRDENQRVKRETLLQLGNCKNLKELLKKTNEEKEWWIKILERRRLQLEDFFQNHRVPTLMIYRYPSEIVPRLKSGVKEAEEKIEEIDGKIRKIKSYM